MKKKIKRLSVSLNKIVRILFLSAIDLGKTLKMNGSEK